MKFWASAALAAVFLVNTSEAAMQELLTFEHAGQTLSAHLYLPDDYVTGDRLPGVVVTGAWTTVKEQIAGTYAAALADRGYAAMAFDFRGWGASPDPIPYFENPTRKTEDIRAAVAFLATRPEVDAGRMAGLGVCASAGYMSDAALNSPLVKSVALVAPWLHDSEIVKEVYGGDAGVSSLIEQGRQAERSDDPVIIEAASLTNPESLMYQAPYYTDPDTGLVPQYDNKFNVASWEGWLRYDALRTAALSAQPTLLVHSEAAAIPQGAKAYASRMGARASELWLDDVSQFDFYAQPDAIRVSADAVAEHFAKTLN